MLKKNLFISMCVLAGLMVGGAASAQNTYMGGTVGKARWNDDCQGATKCETRSNAYKIFGGVNIDKNFAVEASYFSLGTISGTVNISGANATAEAKATGFDIAGVVKHDFTDEISGFAKLGLSRAKVDGKANIPGTFLPTVDTTSTQPVFGLGMTYKLSKEFALRGEFESRRVKLSTEKDTVNTFSIGAQYSF